MTTKLYYEDLYQKEFDASILEVRQKGGRFHICLDRTAFYPEGGGQPCDTGALDGILVEQVYEEDGKIFHVADAAPRGTQVHGQIDWERRFDLMQQHLGQHILSAVLVNELGAGTIGLRMSREAVSIDLDRRISDEQLRHAELTANMALYADLPVEVLYPSIEEVRMYSKRHIPQTDAPLRVIKIGSLDYTPCCGTHNRSSAEVGIIKVGGSELVKGDMRIHFSCGRAALEKLRMQASVLEDLRKELSAKEEELPFLVKKLRQDYSAVREEKQVLLNRTAQLYAEKLLAQAGQTEQFTVVSHVFEHTTQEELKQIYEHLTAKGGVAAVLGGQTAEGAMLLAGCKRSEKQIDVRPAFQAGLALIEGKGGGSSTCAQGIGSNHEQLSRAVETVFGVFRREIIMKDFSQTKGQYAAKIQKPFSAGSKSAVRAKSGEASYKDGHYHGAFFYPKQS